MIQVFSRMIYRAFVISMLFIIWDEKAIYGLPFGILVGIGSEFNNIKK